MLEIIEREIVYISYYFMVQFRQIFVYWVLGMVIGSLISVFAKDAIHSLFAGLKSDTCKPAGDAVSSVYVRDNSYRSIVFQAGDAGRLAGGIHDEQYPPESAAYAVQHSSWRHCARRADHKLYPVRHFSRGCCEDLF